MQSIEERLSRLERSSRWWRWSALLLGCAIVFGGMTAADKLQESILTGNRLVLFDEDTKGRIELGYYNGAARLVMTSQDEKSRCVLFAGDDEQKIYLGDSPQCFEVTIGQRGDSNSSKLALKREFAECLMVEAKGGDTHLTMQSGTKDTDRPQAWTNISVRAHKRTDRRSVR